MTIGTVELDQMQKSYKAAVEEWIAAIKQEEALASVNHDVAEVDKWQAAHFSEEDLRNNSRLRRSDTRMLFARNSSDFKLAAERQTG